MVCRVSQLVLLVLYRITLTTSSGIANMKYRPYGPRMCLQVCGHSGGSSVGLNVYHCRRTSKKDKQGFKFLSTEDPFVCFKRYEMVDGLSGQTPSHATGTEDVPTLLWTHETTTATSNKSEKTLQCNRYNKALLKACSLGRMAVVQRSVSFGLDINCRGKLGWTAVMLAAGKGHLAVFDFLVNQRCDMSVVDELNNTVLHHACKGGNTNIVKKILDRRTHQLEHRGEYERTPLMTAAYYCKREVFDFLINKGCNVTAADNHGRNSLHWASQEGCINIVNSILSKCIISRESKDTEGLTPLLLAAFFGRTQMVIFLLIRGCSLDAEDVNDNGILHMACEGGHTDLLKYLLTRKEVDLHKKNKHGETPMQVAERRNMTAATVFIKARLQT